MVGCHGSRAQARTQRSYWNRINLREAKSAFFRDKSYRCQRGGEKKKKRYKSAVFARGSLHFHWDRSVSVFHFFPLPSLPSRAAIVQNDKDHSQYTRSPPRRRMEGKHRRCVDISSRAFNGASIERSQESQARVARTLFYEYVDSCYRNFEMRFAPSGAGVLECLRRRDEKPCSFYSPRSANLLSFSPICQRTPPFTPVAAVVIVFK